MPNGPVWGLRVMQKMRENLVAVLGLAGLARRDQSFQLLEFAVDAQGKVRCSDSLCAAGCVRLGEYLLAVVLPSEVGAELILEEDDGSFKKIWKSA